MTATLDEFSRLREPAAEPYRPARREREEHPRGWEPGVAYAAGERYVTAVVDRPTSPQWDDVIVRFGFDPAEVEVVDDTVECRTWQTFSKEAGVVDLYYYRARLRSRRPELDDEADRVSLAAAVRRWRKPRRPIGVDEDRALVVCLSDWQIGKGEGGGTTAIVDRVLGMACAVQERIAELRRLRRPVSVLYVVGIGDLVEGCDGHYAMQTFTADADRREQVKVVRRLLAECLRRWVAVVPRIVVGCVPGNHGENRRDGKSFTTFGDNDDVAVFEQVADMVGENPEIAERISFVIPRDELAITLDVCGTIVGFAHGHQARSGSSGPQRRLEEWWRGQAFGDQPVGDAAILVTGHYHHLSVVEYGSKTHMQAPAMDGGSAWWVHTSGQAARRGTLTFVVGKDGWSDLAVLASEPAQEAAE